MKITIRQYTSADAKETAELFYNTVHAVNSHDYTDRQLHAWAPKDRDLDEWNRSFCGKRTFVAVDALNGTVIGFADIDICVSCSICTVGQLDRLYVHKDYQRKGVANMLLRQIERTACDDAASIITTFASITAKPFFEKMGYETVRENSVERCGVTLTNYLMKKEI